MLRVRVNMIAYLLGYTAADMRVRQAARGYGHDGDACAEGTITYMPGIGARLETQPDNDTCAVSPTKSP